MRIGDILYFSPNYKYSDLNWDEKKDLIEAFIDRVKGFYIKPAEQLNIDKKGFATGVLCITTIDFLAKMLYSNGNRIKKWLKENITIFKEPDPNDLNNPPRSLADRFYNEFRDGLIHEGRIKNAGQFSYDIQEIIKVEEGVMIINPNKLLREINNFLDAYLTKVRENEYIFFQFKDSLKKIFKKEIDYSKK